MKAYSEDLRQKVVQAIEQRGTSKSQAARLFGISLSSVKRYARLASQGESLTPEREVDGLPKPTRLQGSSSKRTYVEGQQLPSRIGVTSWRASVAGASANPPSGGSSNGWASAEKKDCGGDGTRRVAEGRLESDTRPTDRSKAAGVRGRDGHQHLTCSSASLVA